MKKLLLLSLFFAATKYGQAQYSLAFCEEVSGEGKPIMISNSFMVDSTGGLMKFYLKSEKDFGTEMLDFRLYYLDNAGKEEELERLPQKVEPAWDYVWKEMAFFDPGSYRVKVYNSKGTYLTSANINIKKR